MGAHDIQLLIGHLSTITFFDVLASDAIDGQRVWL